MLAQIRISRADLKGGGTSESPERQLRRIASYCVKYQLKPIEMCFEAQSGHLTDKKPRRLFREFRDRIESGALDVQAVVTYNIDRFTRDKLIGEEWFRILGRRDVQLWEAEDMKEPMPLAEMEDSYTGKLHGAWRESRRTSRRIRDAHDAISDEGRLISGFNDAFGHDYVIKHNDAGVPKRVGLRVVPEEAAWLREATIRVHAGEPLHSIVVDFNARGFKVTDNMLKRRLLSARMCGLQRVQGVLKPANIEPILSRADWERNHELLKTRERRTYRRYALSGLMYCGACGSSMHGGTGGGDARIYKCAKHGLRNKRRCVCGRPARKCVCKSKRNGLAADGLKHPTRRIEFVERFVAEIVRLAYDEDKLLEYATQARVALDAGDSPRLAYEQERDELIARRQASASLVARGLAQEEDVETELADLAQRLNRVEVELAQIPPARDQQSERVTAEEFTRKLNTGGPDYLRAHAERVIAKIELHAVASTMRPYDGFEIQFVDGYVVPKDLVQELADSLNKEWHDERWLSRSHGRQVSDEVEDLIYLLWSTSQMTASDLVERLTADGVATASGAGRWTSSTVVSALKRACARRSVEYVHRVRSRSTYPAKTRQIVWELCREKRPFAEIIEDLERMGVYPPDGTPWKPDRVRGVYASECRARGDKPIVRRQFLSAEEVRRIRLLVRAEGMTYQEAADWLNAAGVQRHSGTPWTRKGVEYVVAREERRLRRDQSSDSLTDEL